jgi:amino acid transporter
MSRLFRKKKINTIVAEGGDEVHGGTGLHRVLNVRDLTFLGIAAVIGAGIFSTIGSAAFHGGPGVSLLFVITAVTCGFSALCYAEFASRVPVSGSAYTYAYVSFGSVDHWLGVDS